MKDQILALKEQIQHIEGEGTKLRQSIAKHNSDIVRNVIIPNEKNVDVRWSDSDIEFYEKGTGNAIMRIDFPKAFINGKFTQDQVRFAISSRNYKVEKTADRIKQFTTILGLVASFVTNEYSEEILDNQMLKLHKQLIDARDTRLLPLQQQYTELKKQVRKLSNQVRQDRENEILENLKHGMQFEPRIREIHNRGEYSKKQIWNIVHLQILKFTHNGQKCNISYKTDLPHHPHLPPMDRMETGMDVSQILNAVLSHPQYNEK